MKGGREGWCRREVHGSKGRRRKDGGGHRGARGGCVGLAGIAAGRGGETLQPTGCWRSRQWNCCVSESLHYFTRTWREVIRGHRNSGLQRFKSCYCATVNCALAPSRAAPGHPGVVVALW